MANKRIISCSITGSIHSPSMSPYLPVTIDQIAQNAIDAANAGAASVHIHARVGEGDMYGAPSSKIEDFQAIVDKIRAVNKDVIICVTTGGGAGMTVEERAAVIPALKPELASMNAGSFNWGLFAIADNPKIKWQHAWEKPMYEMTWDFIFKNTFKDIKGVLGIMNANGTKPELECYDVGHIYNVKWMIDNGLIQGKPFVQFVLGINGACGASPETMFLMKETADRVLGVGNYNFSAFGAGRMEYPVCMTSLLLGGNPRVGMEDNLYLGKGKAATCNADLVEKMVSLMNLMDYEVATPDEARAILGTNKR